MNLQYIHTGEGRIRYDGTNFKYDYYLKDHLGNTRVVFSDENADGNVDINTEVLQVDSYYPFGMRFNNDNTINKQTTQYMYNPDAARTLSHEFFV